MGFESNPQAFNRNGLKTLQMGFIMDAPASLFDGHFDQKCLTTGEIKMNLTYFATNHEDTPFEETFYVTSDQRIIGWTAGKLPWSWKILVNQTEFDPEKVIEAWLNKLFQVVNDGADRFILKELKL